MMLKEHLGTKRFSNYLSLLPFYCLFSERFTVSFPLHFLPGYSVTNEFVPIAEREVLKVKVYRPCR